MDVFSNGNVSEFCRNYNQGGLAQYLNRTGRKPNRALGDKICRKIETQFSLSPYVLDIPCGLESVLTSTTVNHAYKRNTVSHIRKDNIRKFIDLLSDGKAKLFEEKYQLPTLSVHLGGEGARPISNALANKVELSLGIPPLSLDKVNYAIENAPYLLMDEEQLTRCASRLTETLEWKLEIFTSLVDERQAMWHNLLARACDLQSILDERWTMASDKQVMLLNTTFPIALKWKALFNLSTEQYILFLADGDDRNQQALNAQLIKRYFESRTLCSHLMPNVIFKLLTASGIKTIDENQDFTVESWKDFESIQETPQPLLSTQDMFLTLRSDVRENSKLLSDIHLSLFSLSNGKPKATLKQTRTYHQLAKRLMINDDYAVVLPMTTALGLTPELHQQLSTDNPLVITPKYSETNHRFDYRVSVSPI